MIFRSAEQKADLKGMFHRPDRHFFAAGACHILAQAFLDQAQGNEWKASVIVPDQPFRGMHVYVSNGYHVFDYHGFSCRQRFLEHYFGKMRRRFPGWSAEIDELNISPAGESFCHRYRHRLPGQFYKDPMARAVAFVQQFDLPDQLPGSQQA